MDPLGTDFAGQLEIDRWIFVDKQLFGLMSVFGNGVISGWTVTAEEAFKLSISEGQANINYTSARTQFPQNISNVPPNTIRYVYARIKESTGFDESVEFFLSNNKNLTTPGFLLISKVTTGTNSIEAIDDTVRQNIGFLELIRAAINQHKHRGGANNPSKIDLSTEVKGQLPAFRIADFDAEKITTGTFDLSRIPLIDHQDLENVGLLTHPQLDTFVKTLESNNKELFGEIGASNLLQMIIAMKFIHDDSDSAFYFADRKVDETMINEFAVIPGITPNSYIDFDNTTAEVNLENHYIKGVPPTTGTSFYVRYNTDLAWNSAYSRDRLIVSGDTVTLAFNEDDESNIITIEGFESATTPGENLSTGGQELFRKETVLLSDSSGVTANSSATNVVEGFYSGKFSHQQSFRSQFVKEFTEAQDWTTYDSFIVNIKSLSAQHGSVKMYLESDTGVKSSDFVLLEQNEVTQNDDPTANNFEMRIVDLSLISFRDQVKKIVIFSDDLSNPFSFFVDYINIQRAILLPEDGRIVLRYSSSGSLTFSNIQWTSIEPSGTSIDVRVRAASGTAFLSRAEYTPFLNSGDNINLLGTDLEIEITLNADDDRISSPILQEVKILVLSESEIDGYQINTVEEFNRGDASNITVNSSPTNLTISTPIHVGSYYFALGNSISQIYEETTDSNDTFANSELAVLGLNSPISPNLIFKAVERDSGRVSVGNLFEPRSVRRLSSKNFVVADTYNDRVIEFDEDGSVISGFGSINYEHSEKLFPIAASFDIRTSILYVVWSKRIPFTAVDVSKITLKTSTGEEVQLIKDYDKIMNLTTSELNQVESEGQIMPVYLSAQNSALIKQFPTTGGYLLASSDTVSTTISTDSIFYQTISTANGIPLYVGNFAYIDGIFSPTWAEKLDNGNFVVANGTVGIPEYNFPDSVTETISLTSNVSDIIEIDTNNNIIFGSTIVKFSPFAPGRAEKIDNTTMLIAGLKPDGVEGSTQDLTFRSLSGTTENRQNQKQVLNALFFSGSEPFTGTVITLDTRTGATTFEYISPEGILPTDVDVDPVDGLYVVAESSFDKSGRIIKLDSLGNIVFSFGEGLYSLINDVEVQIDGSIVIST